jgi:hypothetical protein
LGSAGRAQCCELYPVIGLTTEKNHGKTSVRVVAKCPDILLAAVEMSVMLLATWFVMPDFCKNIGMHNGTVDGVIGIFH